MTCIVGIETPEGVYIGGDSAATNDSGFQSILASPKVFCLRQQAMSMLLGCTTSYRMVQLLRYELQLPLFEPGMEVETYLVSHFIPAVRACLSAGGFAKKEHEREEGGNFLLAFHNRLFEVQEDYDVLTSLHGYAAVGSGAECALGSLYTSQELVPPKRVELALQAACTHDAYVRPPFHVFLLNQEQDFCNLIARIGT